MPYLTAADLTMITHNLPKITAHRGASGDAPENTLAAIRLAAGEGAQWIEVDVNISRDGVPVLHHDDGLERCSNCLLYTSPSPRD